MSITENSSPERQQEALKITQRRTMYAAGAGIIPFPIADAADLLGMQALMIKDIAAVFEADFNEQNAKSLITALFDDAAAVGLLNFIFEPGTSYGEAFASGDGAAATYALGAVFTQYFSQGGALPDFDPVKSREFFQQELEKGKQIVAGMKAKATGKTAAKDNRQNGHPAAGKSKAAATGKTAAADSRQKPTSYSALLEQNEVLVAELTALQKEVAAIRQSKSNLSRPKVKTELGATGITYLTHWASATLKKIKSKLT